MAKTYEIAFQLAGKLSGGFSKTFQSASKTVQGMSKELNSLNKQASDTSKLVKMRQEVGNAARSYRQAEQKLAAMKQEIAATGKPTQEMIANVQKQKQAVDKAKAALDKKRAALGELDAKMDTAGTSLKELIKRENELAEAADKARKAQEKLANINGKLDKANSAQEKLGSMKASSAGSLATIGAGVAGTMGVPVQQAMAMEDAMAEVRKVVDFDTPDGLANLQKQLEEMSLRIPMSADGLAQIAAAAGQSGIAAKDLATFTEQAAKMGVAFDISAEDAGTMMSKWQSGMGLTQEKTFALADSVNALSNVNAAQAAEIGEVLQRYGALGKVAGMTEQQIAAFAASTVAAGAAPETAATGIKAFMRALGKGGSMSKKQAEAFEGVGLDPMKLQKDLQKDAPAAIISTLETIQKKLPKEKWNEYLSVMFGEEAAVAVGPMMANLDGLKKNFELVGSSANTSGSMLKEFESRSATTSNALTLAKNAAMYAARAVGAPLLEPLKGVATQFVSVAQSAGQWVEKNKPLVMQILKVAGVVVGAVSAFHALRLAFAFVASPLVSLYKGFQLLRKGYLLISSGALKAKAVMIAQSVAAKVSAAAQWLLNTSMLGCPIVWLIAGIAALIAIGVLLYKNWDKVKAGAVALWNGVKACFTAIKNKAIELWQSFNEKFPAMSRIVQIAMVPIRIAIQVGINIFKLLKAAGIALWNGLKACWNGIKSATVKAWQAIQKPLINAWNKFKAFGSYIWGTFKSSFINAFQGIRNKISGIFSGLVGIVKTPMNGIISLVNKAIGAINKINVKIPDWAGGGSIGFNIPKIPKLAEGGITTGATIAEIGEGREQEAVLPLSKLDSLLSNSNNGKSGGNISVNFAPVINISGGEQDAYAQVKRGLSEGQKSLKRELEKLMRNQQRLSYA